MRSPPKRTSPAVTFVTPRIVLSRVERPAPFAPTTVSHSPASTARSVSNSTGRRPYPARIPDSSSIGPNLFPRVVVTQVHGPDLGVSRDLVGAAGGDDLSPREHV